MVELWKCILAVALLSAGVGWAWHPGEERSPAPGTQAQFGALIRAWISSGAHCPQSWPDGATATRSD